ncbi:uncharacterized protein LOC121804138 [Salvia splendens]|uniref:uncharacterized protein LOC121804138 n=1 Tax=Salvia splendens TaxID=180675 RepID=UPI001C27E026|nr:uncharacterized protein LOC121804138 [Salvia splendens]
MMKKLLVFGARLYGHGRGRRMMSTSTNLNPWLMLPPTFDRRRGGMVYNFYSLADEEVVLINKYGPGPEPPEIPDDNARVVGSSHGWLALMNNRNNELFLSNPITRRHIRLPPIQSLPDPVLNLDHVSGKARVSKLILSAAPPGSEECRAMVSYGQDDRLAFCCPGHSQEWLPIGKPYMDRENKTFNVVYPKSYDDFVYSSKSNVFSCLTKSMLHATGLEEWDLTDMDSPKLAWIQTHTDSPSGPIDDELLSEEHLAYVEQTDELFLVSRFIHKRLHKTAFFSTCDIIKEDGWFRTRSSFSSHLALFLGTNHSFAISHLNPNSIYFTDHKRHHHHHHQPDVGIYDCANEILSNCYYPWHQTNTHTNIVPTPVWFTPTLA